MVELLFRVLFQFFRYGHVRRAFEHLRIDDIGNNRLVLAGQVFVKQIDQFLPRYLACAIACGGPVGQARRLRLFVRHGTLRKKGCTQTQRLCENGPNPGSTDFQGVQPLFTQPLCLR